jgi:hypothetical protein
MREKLKCQFAVVDASQIKSWETLLSNSIMNSTDKVFTEGLDMEKKFQELEELQNYLYNICPTTYQNSYVLGDKQSLSGIVQDRLHQEYQPDQALEQAPEQEQEHEHCHQHYHPQKKNHCQPDQVLV